MSQMLGADVEELRALARDFSGNSQKLVQAQKLLDGAVNQLPRYWQGPDAQRFASQWRGQHRGVISRTAAMLDETATELNRHAVEQEQASSTSSLTGGGGTDGKGTESNPGSDSENKTWFDKYVKEPWGVYKFFPDTLRTLRDITFTGDLLLHAKDLKAAWGTPGAIGTFMDSRWFNMGPTTKFLHNGAQLLEGGEYAQSLARGPHAAKIAGLVDGAGKTLGWAGVAIDGASGLNKIIHGNAFGEGYKDGDILGNVKVATDSGAADLVRAGIGAAALIPGPQQPIAILATGAIAIYDNWDKIEAGAQWLGENGPKAVEAVNDFAGDVAENTVAAVSDVVKSPEKLLPWNW
ncbi:WXG100 family type VII secretion target [Arthrobacter sp. TMP15]|uniref:WXG100 family type VII secretion target n=1 Tax=Arthrobacter sp. TMP15 TaxID=3140789 RepID=UPI0031BB1871